MLGSNQRQQAVTERIGESISFTKESFAQLLMLMQLTGQGGLAKAKRAQMSAQNGIVQLVIIGATLIIGVVVYGSIGDAAPDNHSLSDVQSTIDQTVASAFELGAIVPIVLVAVVILGLLGMFGVGGGGRGGRR